MTCASGKKIFTSKGAAMRFTKLVASGRRMRAYRCSECSGWHMTSQVEDEVFIVLKEKIPKNKIHVEDDEEDK